MKTPIVAIIIIVAVIALGFGGYSLLGRNKAVPSKVSDPSPQELSKDGRYVEYSKSNLDKSKDKRRVLYFYASWCPTCQPADANFKKRVSDIPEDVVLIRVNYNDPDTDADEKDLARKYAITYQHTFVQIDKDGNEIAKWNGGDIEKLLERLVKAQKRASFEIFTNGTFRVFTLPVYHNLSPDAYIEAANPNMIKIEKTGVAWDDFFSTLPLKLTAECLTTGTKETFCTGSKGNLKFYLNGVENSEALTEVINDGDKLLVTYGK